MKNKAEQIKEIYGSTERASDALGMSERHFRRLLKGRKPVRQTKILIGELIRKHEFMGGDKCQSI